jgi:hypothetical protein
MRSMREAKSLPRAIGWMPGLFRVPWRRRRRCSSGRGWWGFACSGAEAEWGLGKGRHLFEPNKLRWHSGRGPHEFLVCGRRFRVGGGIHGHGLRYSRWAGLGLANSGREFSPNMDGQSTKPSRWQTKLVILPSEKKNATGFRLEKKCMTQLKCSDIS